MAARRATTGEGRFYIYRIFGSDGETLYIGKGSGRRLAAQKRRFAASGEILERHCSEKKCYAREKALIGEMKPPLNRAPGGNGSRSAKVFERRSKDEIEMDRIGTRVYAARALLRKGEAALLKHISVSNLEQLRQVAYG